MKFEFYLSFIAKLKPERMESKKPNRKFEPKSKLA